MHTGKVLGMQGEERLHKETASVLWWDGRLEGSETKLDKRASVWWRSGRGHEDWLHAGQMIKQVSMLRIMVAWFLTVREGSYKYEREKTNMNPVVMVLSSNYRYW